VITSSQVGVAHLDRSVAFRTALGFGGIGRLVRPPEPDEGGAGFLITNLRAGPTTTPEIFSFGPPTVRRTGTGAPERLGPRATGVATLDEPGVGPDDGPLVPRTAD
jgi:catechol 2,3-dioxygenase-like lactoylglutathione lyase family enzyme